MTPTQSTGIDDKPVDTPFGNEKEDEKYDELYDDNTMKQIYHNQQGILPIIQFGDSLPAGQGMSEGVLKNRILQDEKELDEILGNDQQDQGMTFEDERQGIMNIANDEFVVEGDRENSENTPEEEVENMDTTESEDDNVVGINIDDKVKEDDETLGF